LTIPKIRGAGHLLGAGEAKLPFRKGRLYTSYLYFCATKTAIIIAKKGATSQPFARNRSFVFVLATLVFQRQKGPWWPQKTAFFSVELVLEKCFLFDFFLPIFTTSAFTKLSEYR
jgi:hypothetical protein